MRRAGYSRRGEAVACRPRPGERPELPVPSQQIGGIMGVGFAHRHGGATVLRGPEREMSRMVMLVPGLLTHRAATTVDGGRWAPGAGRDRTLP